MTDTLHTEPAAPRPPEPIAADSGRGVAWVTEAFTLFTRAPLPWIVVGIVFIFGCIALAMIPFIGQLLINVAMPLFIAGLTVAARNLEAGQEFKPDDIMSTFSAKSEKLLILGVIYMGLSIAIIAVVFILVLILGGATVAAAVMSGQMGDAATGATFLLLIMLMVLVAMALYVPLMMAFWFAPLLVHFHGMDPMPALKLSFSACMKNIVPFLLYGIVALVAMIIAAIPLFLGYLVLLPVLFLTIYTSYKDCFRHT